MVNPLPRYRVKFLRKMPLPLDIVPKYRACSLGMDIEVGEKTMTIGQLAKAAGVNRETLRYYERKELVPSPARSKAGYRLYPPEAVRRITFIKRAQDLGFTLKEIKELLSLAASNVRTCQEIKQQTEAKISNIGRKIRDLERMKKRLEELVSECSEENTISECPILDAFSSGRPL